MQMSGEVKMAGELVAGDCITATGYGADASEVEDVAPVGDKVIVSLASGKKAILEPSKRVRLYQ